MADFFISKDKNSSPTFLLEAPDGTATFQITLVATVNSTLVVPANMRVALFDISAGSNVFIGISASPLTLPTGSFTLTKGRLNPVGYFDLTATDTLNFISDTNSFVTVSFFKSG